MDISQWRRLRDKCADNTTLKRVVLVDVTEDKIANESDRVTTSQQWLPEEGHVLHKRKGVVLRLNE